MFSNDRIDLPILLTTFRFMTILSNEEKKKMTLLILQVTPVVVVAKVSTFAFPKGKKRDNYCSFFWKIKFV